MPKKPTTKRRSARNTLRLPDLDHSKTSVLQSLGSTASKRTVDSLNFSGAKFVLLFNSPERELGGHQCDSCYQWHSFLFYC